MISRVGTSAYQNSSLQISQRSVACSFLLLCVSTAKTGGQSAPKGWIGSDEQVWDKGRGAEGIANRQGGWGRGCIYPGQQKLDPGRHSLATLAETG